ncbi:MAG: hypothetical protein Q4Q07_09890 [Tissierellia bacterium]|nr:hypothetical protein [Tissierellia bacterium]
MKKNILICFITLLLLSCSKEAFNKRIFLYGESHGNPIILEREIELWEEYYHNEGMRHLFIEIPYFTGQLLNIWMNADNDEILNQLYANCKGTFAYHPDVLKFYKNIKKKCPETIFHGTDIGHQYDTSGKEYLKYLESQGMEHSREYQLAMENIQEGKEYYTHLDEEYREKVLVKNFIREYEALGEEKIMGIYGAFHVMKESNLEIKGKEKMIESLEKKYGDVIYVKDLTQTAYQEENLKKEKIKIGDITYQRYYMGKIEGFDDVNIEYGDLWKLESKAYDDFKDKKQGDIYIFYKALPFTVKEKEIYILDYQLKRGGRVRLFFRSNETKKNGEYVLQEVQLP